MLTISDKKYIDSTINRAVGHNNGVLMDEVRYEFRLMKEHMSSYPTREEVREISREESRQVIREELNAVVVPCVKEAVDNAIEPHIKRLEHMIGGHEKRIKRLESRHLS